MIRPNRFEGLGVYSFVPPLISDPQTLVSRPPQNEILERSAIYVRYANDPNLERTQMRITHREYIDEDQHLFSDSDSDATDIEIEDHEVEIEDQRDPAPPNDKDWWADRKRRF